MEQYEKSNSEYKKNATLVQGLDLPQIIYNRRDLELPKRMTMTQEIKKEDLENRIKNNKN